MTPTSIISKRVVVVSAFALMLFAAFATPIFAVDKQANVAARLQKLEDIESIRFLLEHYIELNESHDYDAYSKLFAHDGELVMRRGSATGPVAIKAMLDKNFGGAAGSSGAPQGIIHVLSNIKIEVKGDTATATSRWIMLVPTNDNKPRLGGIGHYGDILVRENDEWKFKQRIIYRDIPADEKPKQ